jgi:hypothetical protein
MTKNTKIYSTHRDERKHAYLVENKEKRMRLLDTIMRTRPLENRPLLTLHFEDSAALSSVSSWGR